MRQINHSLLTFALVLIIVFAVSCPSGTTGLLPFPVFLPLTIELTTPAETLSSGEQAAFAISWSHGLEPFTATWSFTDGTDEENLSSSGPDRISEVSAAFENSGPGDKSWTGFVLITDSRGNTLSEDFTFTVAAAP